MCIFIKSFFLFFRFQDKTPYSIMFGPDKCGTSGKVHLIFRYKNPINGSVHVRICPVLLNENIELCLHIMLLKNFTLTLKNGFFK